MKASDLLTERVLTVDSGATLSEALGKMMENNIHTIPVMEGKKYAGMVSYREILRRKSVNPQSKIANFAIRTTGVETSTSLENIIKDLKDSGLHAIPVLRKDTLVGIISRTDIIRKIADIIDSASILCRDVMSTNPISVQPDDMIEQAREKFKSLDVTELPVVDSQGRLSGILRISDISQDLLGKKEKIRYGQYKGTKDQPNIKASSLMSNAVSVKESDSLSDCSNLMISNKLHLVPVIDRNRKLVGVIENSDIIDMLAGRYSEGGLLISVSGLESGEEALYDATYFLGEKFAQRFARFTGHKNGTFSIHVIKYRTEGEVKYSLRTRLHSGNISMSLDSHDWNYAKCLSDIFDVYEKRLKKSLGKD